MLKATIYAFEERLAFVDVSAYWGLVNHMVKSNRVKDFTFQSHFRNIVASIFESIICAKQLLKLLSRRLQFAYNGFRELRQKHTCKFYYLSFKPQFPSPINNVGFLEVV